MKTATVKKNIHKMVDIINDVDYLKSVENLLSYKANAEEYEISDSDKKIIEKRSVAYKKNKESLMTWNEAKAKLLTKHKEK